MAAIPAELLYANDLLKLRKYLHFKILPVTVKVEDHEYTIIITGILPAFSCTEHFSGRLPKRA